MTTADTLREHWLRLRERLQGKGLLAGDAGVSLRIPGADAMWFGAAVDESPVRLPWRRQPAGEGAALHAAVYAARADAGGVACGGGPFGLCLADFGATLPQLFDEQARHLGGMGPAASGLGEVARALRGGGNVLLVQGRPVCLGTTATRLALNAELFEKCAKAYVLAAATGGRLEPLPWIVRRVANGRLAKDERRAAERFLQGRLPEESQGY